MLTCSGLTARASLIIDGELPRDERFGVRLHLLICPYCRRFLKQLRALAGAIRLRGEQKAAEPADDALHERILNTLLGGDNFPHSPSG